MQLLVKGMGRRWDRWPATYAETIRVIVKMGGEGVGVTGPVGDEASAASVCAKTIGLGGAGRSDRDRMLVDKRL